MSGASTRRPSEHAFARVTRPHGTTLKESCARLGLQNVRIHVCSRKALMHPAGEADFKLPLSHDTLVDLVDKGKRAWCGWSIFSKSLAVKPTQSMCGGCFGVEANTVNVRLTRVGIYTISKEKTPFR